MQEKENLVPDFESCFRQLYPTMCIYVGRYLKEDSLVEDIVQEAFLKLWDKYDNFDHLYKIKAFLYITVKNSALNLLKQTVASDKYNERYLSEPVLLEAEFERAIIEGERNRMIHQAIELLPPQTKKVVELSMSDKTNQEIAEILGISIDTVKTLKKRAYKVLREELADHYLLTVILFTSLFL